MITFIWLFALVIVAGAAWLVASSAGKRKRSEQAGTSEVQSERDGGGAPRTGRASGND